MPIAVKIKKISCPVKTGDIVQFGSYTGVVGLFKRGEITIRYKINETSGWSDSYTVRKLNGMFLRGEISLIDNSQPQ